MPLPTVRIATICLGHETCSTFGSTRTCIWLSTRGPGIANHSIQRSLRGNAEHRNFARKVVPSISVLDVCCRQKDPFRTAKRGSATTIAEGVLLPAQSPQPSSGSLYRLQHNLAMLIRQNDLKDNLRTNALQSSGRSRATFGVPERDKAIASTRCE